MIRILVAAAAIAIAGPALGQAYRPAQFHCPSLAEFIWQMTTYRDTGAKLELVLPMVWDRKDIRPGPHRDVLAREIRRMYREGLDAREASESAFKRCVMQLGDMGRDG